MTNSFNFEQIAQSLIQESMEQNETPFRSAISDILSTVSTTAKTADSLMKSAYFASVELQLEQMNSLLSNAKKMDARNETQSIINIMKANELRKAMETQNA